MSTAFGARRRPRHAFVASLLAFAIAASPIARADGPSRRQPAAEASDARPREALECYERGREFYQQGRYAEAAEQLEQAVIIDPTSATLSYNVARVRELMNDHEAAIRHYQRFMELSGTRNPEDRRRAEAAIARLSAALEVQRAADAEAARLAAAREAEEREARERELREAEERARLDAESRVRTRRGVADIAFWLALSGGVATLGAGGVLAYLAWDSDHTAQTFLVGENGSLADRARIVDRAQTYALTADILFGVGGGLVITSVLLFALRTEDVIDPAPPPLTVDASASPNGFFVRLGGSL